MTINDIDNDENAQTLFAMLASEAEEVEVRCARYELLRREVLRFCNLTERQARKRGLVTLNQLIHQAKPRINSHIEHIEHTRNIIDD